MWILNLISFLKNITLTFQKTQKRLHILYWDVSGFVFRWLIHSLICTTWYCHWILTWVCSWPLNWLPHPRFFLKHSWRMCTISYNQPVCAQTFLKKYLSPCPTRFLHHNVTMVKVTRHVQWNFKIARDFLIFSPTPSTYCYVALHPSIWASSLDFISMKGVQSTVAPAPSHPVCRGMAAKTIGSNLVSLSCCHNEWVSSANQQLYLWPAEKNLVDLIPCAHTICYAWHHTPPCQTSYHTQTFTEPCV